MRIRSAVQTAVAAGIAVILIAGASADASEPKRVFIVHSYENGHICGQPQHDGVIEALAKAGFELNKDYVTHVFYMDTQKTYTTQEQIAKRGSQALEQVRSVKPDVIVVFDDNAARTVMLPLAGGDTPVVFCGMNGQPEQYNKLKRFMDSREKPRGNVTGVYEKLHVTTSIKVLCGVQPELSKVLAITDCSPTGNAITIQLENELSKNPAPIPCEIARVKNFAEYQDLILNRVNRDPEIGAIYSMVVKVNGPDGTKLTAPDVIKWQIAHCNKPSMALNYFFAKLGLFGGAAVDFKAMGRQAGEKTARILKGEKTGDLPIEDARKYAIVFNTARAKDLGIEIPLEILGAADYVYGTIEAK